ncbi:hypothetical protein QOZ80_8AG0635900 [Eleusine coracana subsp. coracana]|nr:hypothetical protein QOZ80_8AG0635900 [Eleusine coracana subsp. coracana]
MANGGVDESPEAEEQQHVPVPKSSPAAAPTKGRGLRRWRRIRRELHREGNTDRGGGRGDEDSAKLHKRRIPFPAGAPKAKHESAPAVEDESSSTASVESRFIPQAPAKLGFRVASAGFTIGADSDHSDDRSSRSSTAAAGAPRVFARHGPSSTLHGRHPRSRDDRLMRAHATAGPTEPENSRSSAESDPRCSVAWHVGDRSDEEHLSEDVRSTAAGGYCKENDSSVLGRLARRSADSDDGVDDTLVDGNARNGKNGGFRSGDDDPYAESVLLLQRTQEALENEIEKLVAVGKVPNDEFGIYDDERSGSVHLKEPIEEVCEKINHLESRLEETSAQIKEKDSRILELEDLSRMQPRKTAMESTNLLLSPSELDGLYQEKIEVEIQGIILTRAYQTVATRAGDQMALYEAQKSLSEDYKQLGLKLRHAENRALMLEEKADKLEVQCTELIRSSEVLQLQSKASRVSLFSFIQFILLCIAIATYLMRLVPASSTDVVPT